MSTLRDLESKYYMQVARRQPIVLVRGQGTRVWDEDGKEYLDFTSGWAVNSLGTLSSRSGQGDTGAGRHPDPDLQPVLHCTPDRAGALAGGQQLP